MGHWPGGKVDAGWLKGRAGGVWAENAPSGATTVRTGSWARNGLPLTTPGGGLESQVAGADLPATHCVVVLQGWEWPGDWLFRLPAGSRDVAIDGHSRGRGSTDDEGS